MITNSKKLIKLVKKDGWVLDRIEGSHHAFRHPTKDGIVVIPHPRKDIKKGTVGNIYRQAQIKEE